MNIELTYTSLQVLKWVCLIGVPSFFLGWFTHGLWEWLMAPPGSSRKERH